MKQKLQLLATCAFFALFSLAFSNTASAQELFWTDVSTSVSEINNTYTITTPQELAWIAQQTNAGNDFSGKTVVLAGNINLQGRSWVPIGIFFSHFKGTFDGQGYGIDYITTNRNPGDASYAYSGLFGMVSNGTLKNVWIGSNSYIKGGAEPNGVGTGGLAGVVINSSIENCYNLSVVTGGDGDLSVSAAGGIAGWAKNITVSGCYNYASIHHAVSSVPISGGIIGYLESLATLTLNSCYSLDQTGAGSGDVTQLVGGSAGTVNEQDCSILTTTQFKEKANFVGWDFLNTWTYISGNSYAYPVFRNAATAGSAIDVQPQGGSVCPGDDYTFSVTASGINPVYQWYKNGLQIPGATQSSYTLTGATAQDVGNQYTVRVSCNDNLSELSQAAGIKLYQPVAILSPPKNADIYAGSDHTFRVEAVGSGLTYQWYKGGLPIAGANRDTLQITGAKYQDYDTYKVVVTDRCGDSASATTTLSIEQTIPTFTREIRIPQTPGVTMIFPAQYGNYYIGSSGNFNFTVRYDKEPALKVTTNRTIDGVTEELTGTKNANGEYEYVIRTVQQNIVLLFGPDNATDNIEIVDGKAIWSYGSTIYIRVEKDDIASIYSIAGQLVKQVELTEGSASIPMTRGIYIIMLKDGSVHKVILK